MIVSKVNQTAVMPDYFCCPKNEKTVNFEGRAKTARLIESQLEQKGIKCDFQKNGYVAKCVQRTVRIYEDLFGKWSFPKAINYRKFGPIHQGTLAWFDADDIIEFNKDRLDFNNVVFQYIASQKRGLPTLKSRFAFSASTHRSETYVHEFAHCAHFHNISQKHSGNDYAREMMKVLKEKELHEPVGRLITKFQLGRYSLTNMDEFIAERITNDISNNLAGREWNFVYGKPDVGYSDIFSRKWHDKFETPQAYLDYYTEQVWDGDLHNADEASERIRKFLELLELKIPVQQALRIRDSLIPLEQQKDALTEKILVLKKEIVPLKEKLKNVETLLEAHPYRQRHINNAIEITQQIVEKIKVLKDLNTQKSSTLSKMSEVSEVSILKERLEPEISTQETETKESKKAFSKYKKSNKTYQENLKTAISIAEAQREAARRNAEARERARNAEFYGRSYASPSRSTVAEKSVKAETVTEKETSTVTVSSAKTETVKGESLGSRLLRGLNSLFSGSIFETDTSPELKLKL